LFQSAISWRDKALTASPGQHLSCECATTKSEPVLKAPDQACNQSKNDVTYRLPSWQSSWRYTPQALRDCVNTYAVHKIHPALRCACPPSCPYQWNSFQLINYCFDDKTDLLSIESTEACYMRLMASISRYEMEARQLCLDIVRAEVVRHQTRLTIDSATDFLHNSLGDWSYPYNFLFSKGVANLFYMDIRTKE
uniref:Cullin domain-containing protein n=1 Tax=Macrostomum lignano TaxID=282301 RepID=A0A1I8FTI3_9PLAT